jgi:hypothetical protein
MGPIWNSLKKWDEEKWDQEMNKAKFKKKLNTGIKSMFNDMVKEKK